MLQRVVRSRSAGRSANSRTTRGASPPVAARLIASCGVVFISSLWLVATGRAARPVQQYPSTGAHRTHTTDGALHLAYRCDRCHEPDPAAHLETVTIDGFDPAAKTCRNVYCHGAFAGGNRGNLPQWTLTDGSQAPCGSCHALPPSTGAHQPHVSAEIACATCHHDPAFPSLHANGRADVIFGEHAAGGVFDGASCGNIYCHGNARGRKVAVEWTGPSQGCMACHDDETVNRPQMSGRHASHLAVGLACADCHASVVNRKKTIVSAALHANGRADVKLLAGRYENGSCLPACHDQRSW